MHQTFPTANDISHRTRGTLLGGASQREEECAAQGGPPFWEEWRGEVADEDIEFVRVIFEEFCASWE